MGERKDCVGSNGGVVLGPRREGKDPRTSEETLPETCVWAGLCLPPFPSPSPEPQMASASMVSLRPTFKGFWKEFRFPRMCSTI